MMSRPDRSTDKLRRRRGFTLIELLVVIAIIALLASMVLVVYARSGENARVASTKTLVKQLDAALQDRLEGLRRADIQRAADAYFSTVTQSELRNVLYRTVLLRGTFPQRFQDLYGWDGLTSNAGERKDNAPLYALIRAKDTSKSDAQWETELSSAELLYLVLTEGPTYGLPPLTLEGISPQFISDADGDRFPAFVDGWGQELRFYNFPTALLRPNGNGTNIIVADYTNARYLIRSLPHMPIGMSGSPTALPAPVSTMPSTYSHPLNIDPLDALGEIELVLTTSALQTKFQNQFHTLNTFSTPLIVSSGPDQLPGLLEPNDTGVNRLGKIDTTSTAAIYDNITNHQRGGF